MNMKLLILYHKNQISIFPRIRKAMLYHLFCLVSTYTERKGLVQNANCTLTPIFTVKAQVVLIYSNDIFEMFRSVFSSRSCVVCSLIKTFKDWNTKFKALEDTYFIYF